MQSGFKQIKDTLSWCVESQQEMTETWHYNAPSDAEWATGDDPASRFMGLAMREHWTNFQLWHVEDEARRTDVGPEVIAECKRRIDAFNQQRNDLIERMDECLVTMIEPLLPENAGERHNTETLGSALDRLSILSLKIFHMQEEASRKGASAEHRQKCGKKAQTLSRQHADLLAAALDLVDEYAAGSKRPRVYFQFKMYNDPELNPALYKSGAS